MRISDWSSDVCSSDLARKELSPRLQDAPAGLCHGLLRARYQSSVPTSDRDPSPPAQDRPSCSSGPRSCDRDDRALEADPGPASGQPDRSPAHEQVRREQPASIVECRSWRSEEHTSELQSLMRISYAVFCLKKKNLTKNIIRPHYYYTSYYTI